MQKPRLVQGNQAVAEAAIAAGCRFFAGYPITPSTEIAELMAEHMPRCGGRFIQMEDEIASMGAILGASLAGKKVLTATSGPGFSLMQELIGYAAIAEIPSVIANVQRFGPSTGRPTSPAQGDVMQARWGTHGDRGVIALTPSSVAECYSVTLKAFDFAEKFRMPVILLLDEIIGHMRERVELPEAHEVQSIYRKQPIVPEERFMPYQPDEDEIPAMPPFGSGYRYHVTGLVHGQNGLPSESPEVARKLIARLHEKISREHDEIEMYEEYFADVADYLVVAYGGTARSALAAVKTARKLGINAGLLRLITIWPFPYHALEKCSRFAKKVLVPELNYGQLVGEVIKTCGEAMVFPINRYDGEIMTPDKILVQLKAVARR